MGHFKEHLERLLNLDLTQWQAWLIITAFLCTAMLVFLLGFITLKKLSWGRRQKKVLNPINALVSDAEAKAAPRHGVIIGRSRRGVDVLVDDPAEPEAILSVRSARAPANIPWVQIAVVQCRSAGKNFLLHCEFVERPPWKVVVWFG